MNSTCFELARRRTPVRIAIATLAAVMLAACAGGPLGLPGGDRSDEPVRIQTVEGRVDSVDTRNRTVAVSADRDSPIAAGQRVDLYYDDRTTVSYQGQEYRPQDLERGDRIAARVEQDGRSLEARSIVVTEDATPADRDSDSRISGTLRQIDSRDRTLTVDTYGTGPDMVVRYDSRTRVYLDDRSIAVSELRERDQVEIELVPESRFELADTITVVDDRYGADSQPGLASARGEVVAVDEQRKMLVISTPDRDALISSFDTRADDTVTFYYNSDVVVEYRGDFYTPANLERGDGVEVEFERVGDDLWAERILVTSNVRN